MIWEIGAGLAALVFSGLVSRSLARRWGTPAARPLLFLTLTLAVAVGVFTVLVSPAGEVIGGGLGIGFPPERLWLLLSFNTAGVVAAAWFVFALRYTGRGRLLSRPLVGGVGLLPAAILGLSALLVTGTTLGVDTALLESVLGILTFTLNALLFVGAVLVVQPSFGERSLPVGQGLSLVGVALFVSAGPILGQVFFDTPVLFPALLLGSLSCLSVCLFRYEPFSALPVARAIERDEILEAFAAAVLVVDAEDRIRDLNGAAATVFDVDSEAVLRRPLGDAIPAFGDGPGSDARVETGSGRTLSVETTAVTDPRGAAVGRLLICRDVTDREARERRLQVLTQVLAETVRDRMDGVASAVAPLAEGDEPRSAAGDIAGTVRRRTTGLIRLIARVRTVERGLSDGTDEGSADPESVVHDAVDEVRSFSDTTVEVSAGATVPPVAVTPSVATAALGALVEHAARRADSHVGVNVQTTDDTVRIGVVDDGPTPEATSGTVDPTRPDTVALPVLLAAVVAVAPGGSVSVTKTEQGRRNVVTAVPRADAQRRPADSEVSP